MSPYQITVIPGDGIGPEVIDSAMRVVEATKIPVAWHISHAGEHTQIREGNPLPEKTIESIKHSRVAIKGPTNTPVGSGFRSINVELRKIFDLFANVRPVVSIPGITTLFSNVDVVIFRENTEDLYIGEERMAKDGVAEAVSRITRDGSERIARYAFEYAVRHNRKKVTVVHKANILKLTHGLFLETARGVAKSYPKIEFNNMIADNFMLQLVRNHKQFDCILLPNFLGDLASDLCAGLVGGLGLAPGANIGKKYAIFEAVHGTAPDIMGKKIANPTAIILSAALMLEHIGEFDAAKRVTNAVKKVLVEGVYVTPDINPGHHVSTDTFTNAIISNL
ncbi:NAD-dependent isocitrate dehydrogenase [Candidatus Jorgensenbacteria bacterium]|nr:NAD-dependent isocitrate dehydrogenase [Candidatus Jorgensenbacteria bacterium]